LISKIGLALIIAYVPGVIFGDTVWWHDSHSLDLYYSHSFELFNSHNVGAGVGTNSAVGPGALVTQSFLSSDPGGSIAASVSHDASLLLSASRLPSAEPRSTALNHGDGDTNGSVQIGEVNHGDGDTARVQIGALSTTPEPATLGLLLFGLPVVWLLKRKRV